MEQPGKCKTSPTAKHSVKWLGPPLTVERRLQAGISWHGPAWAESFGAVRPKGPESAARPAVARPKRAAGGGGGTHVPSQPAQQPRSTADINMRGLRGLRPALPGVARARPRPRPRRLGDLEEGGKEEEGAVPCRVRDGRAQGFAPSRRRGQPEAAPRIPRCCRGEPGPARPGRKTEAAGRGRAGPGLAEGGV